MEGHLYQFWAQSATQKFSNQKKMSKNSPTSYPPKKYEKYDENLTWIYTDILTDHSQYMMIFNLNLSLMYTDIYTDIFPKIGSIFNYKGIFNL